MRRPPAAGRQNGAKRGIGARAARPGRGRRRAARASPGFLLLGPAAGEGARRRRPALRAARTRGPRPGPSAAGSARRPPPPTMGRERGGGGAGGGARGGSLCGPRPRSGPPRRVALPAAPRNDAVERGARGVVAPGSGHGPRRQTRTGCSGAGSAARGGPRGLRLSGRSAARSGGLGPGALTNLVELFAYIRVNVYVVHTVRHLPWASAAAAASCRSARSGSSSRTSGGGGAIRHFRGGGGRGRDGASAGGGSGQPGPWGRRRFLLCLREAPGTEGGRAAFGGGVSSHTPPVLPYSAARCFLTPVTAGASGGAGAVCPRRRNATRSPGSSAPEAREQGPAPARSSLRPTAFHLTRKPWVPADGRYL